MKLTEIRRPSDKFHTIAKQIERGIIAALVQNGHGNATAQYEDTISSVAFDALEELLDRIYEIEARQKELA